MENIRYEKRGNVGVITLSRPERLNAVSRAMLGELDGALEAAGRDADIRCLIVTGAGEKAFAAGADIAEMKEMTLPEARAFSLAGGRVMEALERFETPVIAAVNGYALGGGCEIALSCDIRVAAENAVFGQPEVTLGIVPGFGGGQRLAKIIGIGAAKEMLFTGESIGARQALALGLVNRVVPKGAAAGEALALAEKIAQNPPAAVRACKRAAGHAMRYGLDSGLAYENELFAQCFAGTEQKQRMEAFLSRRHGTGRDCRPGGKGRSGS